MAKIVWGISGSISAYRAHDIVRELYHQGHDVHVILTPNATQFVTPLTLASLTGNKAHVDEFPEEIQKTAPGTNNENMPHIFLKQDVDLMVICPATANVIAKLAMGLGDNLLTSTYLALDRTVAGVLICPAMNPNMWNHPATQKNLKTIKSYGDHILDPTNGVVACGDEGSGKLATPADILTKVGAMLQSV